MNFNRRQITKGLAAGLATTTALTQLPTTAFAQKKLRIAMVVKVLGINYFDVGRDGGQEAAKELGDADLIYAGPTAATVEQQIAVIDTLIAQHVDVLLISANDAHALIPTTKKAMQRGITVLSFDFGIAPEGRAMQISAPHDELVGANDVRMISKTIGGEGEIAILSATSQATNQNIWIEKMKEELKKPDYAKITLVGVVYGDDAADKSYREGQGLIKGHPNLARHHFADGGRHHRRLQGGDRRWSHWQGLCHRAWAAVRDEVERVVRRVPNLPALESGRPRLRRCDVRGHDRTGQVEARAWRHHEDWPLGRHDHRGGEQRFLEDFIDLRQVEYREIRRPVLSDGRRSTSLLNRRAESQPGKPQWPGG